MNNIVDITTDHPFFILVYKVNVIATKKSQVWHVQGHYLVAY